MKIAQEEENRIKAEGIESAFVDLAGSLGYGKGQAS